MIHEKLHQTYENIVELVYITLDLYMTLATAKYWYYGPHKATKYK